MNLEQLLMNKCDRELLDTISWAKLLVEEIIVKIKPDKNFRRIFQSVILFLIAKFILLFCKILLYILYVLTY